MVYIYIHTLLIKRKSVEYMGSQRELLIMYKLLRIPLFFFSLHTKSSTSCVSLTILNSMEKFMMHLSLSSSVRHVIFPSDCEIVPWLNLSLPSSLKGLLKSFEEDPKKKGNSTTTFYYYFSEAFVFF